MKAKLTLNNPMWQATRRRRMLDRTVQESAAELEGLIKAKMLPSLRKDPPRGKTYRRAALTAKATKANLALGLRRSRSNPNRVVTGSTFHRASAPGQAPAVDTAGLVNSIRARPLGELRAKVATNKNYAEPLEKGSRAPAKRAGRRSTKSSGPVRNLMGPKRGGIAPRPFFEPTAEEFRPKFKENIEEAIRKG